MLGGWGMFRKNWEVAHPNLIFDLFLKKKRIN
jgi:hypothetical protein